MEPPSDSDLEQEHAALLAEQATLKRKLRALEEENAALNARRAELERLAQAGPATGDQQAPDLEGATQVKRPLGPV